MSNAFRAGDVDLDPDRARALIDSGEVQLVDVREPGEWDAGRIAGARHVELEQLAAEANSIDREQPVLFYCRVGARSGMAANAFRREPESVLRSARVCPVCEHVARLRDFAVVEWPGPDGGSSEPGDSVARCPHGYFEQ